MNCKQGDRAVIVRGWPRHLGKIVRVIRPSAGNRLPRGTLYVEDGLKWRRGSQEFAWFCESEGGLLTSRKGTKFMTARPIPDAYLMPLPPEEVVLELDKMREKTT